MSELLQRSFAGIHILHKQLYGPRAHVFVLVGQRLQQAFLGEQPGDMQGPHPPQTIVRILVGVKLRAKRLLRLGVDGALRGAVLQNDPRAARMPVAYARLQRSQLRVGQGSEIVVASFPFLRERGFGRDTENAARILVQHVVAANVAVMPVQHIQRPLGAHLHAEADPLRIVGHQEIFAVAGHIPRSLGSEDVRQHGMFVNVRHEQAALMLRRKRVRLVYPGASVGRAMAVIHDGLDVAVDVRIEMLPALAMINAALDDMEYMRNHAGRDEKLALGVVIDAPGIAETMRHHLETILRRVVSPYAPVYVDALSFQNIFGEGLPMDIDLLAGLRFVDSGRRREAFEAIEPTVRAPMQAVEGLVAIPDAPSRKENFNVALVGHVVSVAIRNEHKMGRRAQIHAPEPDRDRRRKRNPFQKHLAAIRHAVPIRIFQNKNATVSKVREPGLAAFVVAIFGDP